MKFEPKEIFIKKRPDGCYDAEVNMGEGRFYIYEATCSGELLISEATIRDQEATLQITCKIRRTGSEELVFFKAAELVQEGGAK